MRMRFVTLALVLVSLLGCESGNARTPESETSTPVQQDGSAANPPAVSNATERPESPAPTPPSRGPAPAYIRAECAMEVDEEATGFFLAYGPLNDANADQILGMWRQSVDGATAMAYTRCLNVKWNFKDGY